MPRTALIVDDSASMLQMISFTLKNAGFEVLEGMNGQQGLDQLRASRVDLIISDVNMPVMDGLSFVRQVRALNDHRFTPVLMLTTETRQEKKLEAKAAGATGWLTKPFDPDQLMKVVARVLP